MSRVFSFAEESCYDKAEKFRSIRKSVDFRVVSIGRIGDDRVDFRLKADWGIFYDPEDEYLIQHLQSAHPAIDWGYFVFYRKWTSGELEIIDPGLDRVVGKISVWRALPSDPDGEQDWTNVTDLNAWKVEHERI